MSKTKKKKAFVLEVKGINSVKKGLMDLGLTAKQSRSQINKALRPAANKLAKGMQRAYKNQFVSKNPGRRYNPSTGKYVFGTRTSDTIGVITARRSKQPGLFVGPTIKKVNPHYWKRGASKNLAAMQINGYYRGKKFIKYPNVFKATAKTMGEEVSKKAQKDLGRLLDKMIRKAGF